MSNRSPFFQICCFIGCLILFPSSTASAQHYDNLDSLKNVLTQSIPDSTRVRICIFLADNLPEDEWFEYNQKAHQLANQLIPQLNGQEKREIQILLGAAESNLGYYHDNKGDLLKAIEHYYKALEIYDHIDYLKGKGQVFGNLGVLYNEQGDFQEALDLLNKSLEIREKHDISEVSKTYMSLGFTHESLGNDEKALGYLLKGLEMAEKYQVDSDIAIALNNVGAFYFLKGKENLAIPYYRKAIKKSIEIGNEVDAAWVMGNMSSYFLNENKIDSAEFYAEQGLAIAERYDILILKETIYDRMHHLRKSQNRWKEAYQYQSIFNNIKDSLGNLQGQKTALKRKLEYDHELEKTTIALKHEAEKERAKTQRIYLTTGLVLILILLFIYYRSYIRKKKDNITISRERDRSDELLLNILPLSIAKELKKNGFAEPKFYESVSILFTDFEGFTKFSEHLSPKELVQEIDYCYKAFDNIIEEHQLEKIKTIGDSYMCASGLPEENSNHGFIMVKAAIAIRNFMIQYANQRKAEGKNPLAIRIGIHSGSVVAGVVGKRKFAYDIWGDAVNTASRIESSGQVGKINISQTTYNLIQNYFDCTSRGKIKAKNKGEIEMYFVNNELTN